MVEISTEALLHPRPSIRAPFGNKPLRNYTKNKHGVAHPSEIFVSLAGSFLRRTTRIFLLNSPSCLSCKCPKGGFLTVETRDGFRTLKQRLNVSPHHKVRKLAELFFDNFVFDTLFSDRAQKPRFLLYNVHLIITSVRAETNRGIVVW